MRNVVVVAAAADTSYFLRLDIVVAPAGRVFMLPGAAW